MNNEWTRYMSYKDFPQSSSVSPLRLAKAGFYYTGQREEATCFSCGLTLATWTTDETISDIHQRLSPYCRHLTGEDKSNVPIHDEQCSESTENYSVNDNTRPTCSPSQRSNIKSGANGAFGVDDSICVSGVRTDHRTILSESKILMQPNGQIEYFPGINTEKPKHPDYAIKSIRVSSFSNWCLDVMDPEQLAEAGFYYQGVQDCVRCFFCGGGMKNWENGDNAWIEHARWFPNCAYVKQCKGENFVSMCRMANIDFMTANGEMQNMGAEELNIAGGREIVEDHLVQDLNSIAAKLVIGMGNKQEDVEKAIKIAREKYGASELRAQYILEFLIDNRYSNNDSNLLIPNQTDRGRPSGASGCSLDNVQVESKNKPSDMKLEQKRLLEENRMLKDQMICKICLDKDACIVFLPCGHMVSCVECAHALRKCAVCRSIIQGSVRVYQA